MSAVAGDERVSDACDQAHFDTGSTPVGTPSDCEVNMISNRLSPCKVAKRYVNNITAVTGNVFVGTQDGESNCDVVSSCVMSGSKDCRQFSFLHWNVCGILTKLINYDFVHYVSSFDFVCLVETLVENIDWGIFPDFTVFCKPAVRLKKRQKRLGGVICLIRNKIIPYVKDLQCDQNNLLMFLLDKSLFGLSKDVLYVCAYIPPENSPYHTVSDIIDNCIITQMEKLKEQILLLGEVYILLCGDLNSKISDTFTDPTKRLFQHDSSGCYQLPVRQVTTRCSEVTCLDSYGKLLLDLCKTLGLLILNGVYDGNLQENFACISNKGNTVSDYFIASVKFFNYVQSVSRHSVSVGVKSDHLPLECVVDPSAEYVYRTDSNKHVDSMSLEESKWNELNAQQFQYLMSHVSDNCEGVVPVDNPDTLAQNEGNSNSCPCDVEPVDLLGSPSNVSREVLDVNNVSIHKICFSFLHWNIDGVCSKLDDADFLSYVSTFDFICLVETFVEDFHNKAFPKHTAFCKSAVKLSKQGRHSGGVLCFIKTELLPYVKEVIVEYDNFLCFIIDKSLFSLAKDVLYLCAYIPPETSPYYSHTGFDNGLALLEEILVDNLLSNDDMYALICGDLNSRTANKVPDIDDMVHSFTAQRDTHDCINRQSQDMEMNSYGKLLLNICATVGLHILNGLCYGDLAGRFTYVADSGNSVNDYFLVSDNFFPVVNTGSKLLVTERMESDHMPVEFHIEMLADNPRKTNSDHKNKFVEKIMWNPDYAQQFIQLLNSPESQLQLRRAVEQIHVNINEALNLFNSCLKEQAVCMTKRIYFSDKKRKNEWFDSECSDARKNVRKLLTKFCKTLRKDDRIIYCKAKREYKHLLNRKKKETKEALLQKLLNSTHNQQQFWETVRKIAPKKTNVHNDITVDDWFLHFKSVLDKENDITYTSDTENFEFEQYDSWFDQPISKQEVLDALKKVKNSKAAGPDGIIGELLKYSDNTVVDFLVKFYNTLFDEGIYPDQWTESVIFPLFKKGNTNDPNNYRGISLCDISSKI